MQQWAGYCLTGDPKEQALVFIYGPGGNGKTIFQNVLSEIMGDYAKTAAMETFTASKTQRHLTEVAMLDGARLVTASETETDQAWWASRINQFTGGEPITARFIGRDHFTYRPRFKLVIIGNHKPKLPAVNDAARRRFIIVPFTHKPKQPDPALADKLRAEYPAILRWMINGCLDWRKNRLVRPKVVLDATADYFEEQDLMGRWLQERCDCAAGAQSSASDLYASWKQFAEANGESSGTATCFGIRLKELGFSSKKSGKTYYLGIQPKQVT